MRVTAKLEDRHLEFFETVKDEENITSDAETIRRCLERGGDAEDRVDDLDGDASRLKARVHELTNQLREANRRTDEVAELVEYVGAEKSLQERRRERARMEAVRSGGSPDPEPEAES
jgi:hypothetical protein